LNKKQISRDPGSISLPEAMTMRNTMNIIATLLAGGALLAFSPAAFGQTPDADSRAKVSDGDLKAFVRTYVETQRLRDIYEPQIQNAADQAEKREIQKQAAEELQDTLEGENLTVDDYNRIFRIVNSDDGLRVIVLRMIEEERSNSR
jgi:endonuclease YncB( thermonuclease family)